MEHKHEKQMQTQTVQFTCYSVKEHLKTPLRVLFFLSETRQKGRGSKKESRLSAGLFNLLYGISFVVFVTSSSQSPVANAAT